MPQPQPKPIEKRDPYAAMVLDAFDRMEAEPDQIDMMSEEELREELRRFLSPKESDWSCDCKSTAIRWIDESRLHPAVTGPGWFCMGCLAEFKPLIPHSTTKPTEKTANRCVCGNCDGTDCCGY